MKMIIGRSAKQTMDWNDETDNKKRVKIKIEKHINTNTTNE